MRQKAALYFLLFAGLVICAWRATSLARANRGLESAGAYLAPKQAAAHDQNSATQMSVESSTLLTYTWAVAGSPVDYALTSVDMVSATEGWAVGYWDRAGNGDPWGETILRWNGVEWYEWYSWSDDPPLFSVEMIASGDGWAAGSGGKILRWDGNDWNTVSNPSSDRTRSVSMVSGTDGWAVGGSGICSSGIHGKILRWEGDEWSVWASSIPDRILNSVDMVSTNDGWAVGYYCKFGIPVDYDSVIMRWNGSSWNEVSSPVENILYDVTMVSATDGWAVGEQGVILRWNGSVWNEVDRPALCQLNSVSMASATEGWAVGGGGYPCSSGEPSLILHWDGNVWSKVDSPVSQALNSISMISSEEGWAVGEGGTILHYTSLDKLVRVVGAATADYDWNWKSEFNPGDPIRYIILIVNETGSDAEIELTYEAKGPHNEPVFDDHYTDTIPPGLWQWGGDWTVPEGMGGTHTFTGSGLYMETSSQAVITYTVTGPTSYSVYLPLALK